MIALPTFQEEIADAFDRLDDSVAREMPILERYVEQHRRERPLRGATALLIQHQLGNHFLEAKALLDLGLDHRRLFWIDVPYTSHAVVRDALRELDIPRENLMVHDYHLLDRYPAYHLGRVQEMLRRLGKMHPSPLLVLDDGAYFLEAMASMRERPADVVIVEQTTRGLIKLEENAALRWTAKQVPIVNVARSTPKQNLEPPFIGISVCRALLGRIAPYTASRPRARCLVLGFGAIGRQVAECLCLQAGIARKDVHVFDLEPCRLIEAVRRGFAIWDRSNFDLKFDLVVGCSGRASFQLGDYVYLNDGAKLASGSSGSVELSRQDFIEFADASGRDDVYVMREEIRGEDLHGDIPMWLVDRKVTFLNGGFPINFDGRVNCIPARYIQPTPTMMVAAAVQGVACKKPGLVELEPAFCKWLDEAFRAELGPQAGVLSLGTVSRERPPEAPSPSDHPIELERRFIRKRREYANAQAKEAHELPLYPKGPGNPALDAVALCLSGGGIRSATFNLGLLQAFERCALLPRIDYLSTVSGGGYIGCSLTWFMSHLGQPFPFGKSRTDNAGTAGAVVHHLRDRGQYLAPGGDLNGFTLVAAILTGLVVNLVILAPIVFLSVLALSQRLPGQSSLTYFNCLSVGGIVALVLFGLVMIVQALTSSFLCLRRFNLETYLAKVNGVLLAWAVGLTIAGSIPLVHDWLVGFLPRAARWAMGTTSLLGAVTSGWAVLSKPKDARVSRARAVLMTVGIALLLYGVVVWVYRLAQHPPTSFWWLLAAAVSVGMGFVANINYMSMHRFYRNRLREAFLPHKLADTLAGGPGYEKAKKPVTLGDSDLCLLRKFKLSTAPYHIINTAVATCGSEDPKLRGRGMDSFILSPLYCGSEATGYAATGKYCNGNMNLATAMAISGAAVDTNTPPTKSWPLSLLMALMNIRLGYWTEAPTAPGSRARLGWRPLWYPCIFYEMIPSLLSERLKRVHLSDGGHFENLGLYEMIRRRCSLIIVSDASADAERKCAELGRAIELVRTDLCARVDIDPGELTTKAPVEPHDKPFVRGTIYYRDGTVGTLIYIKPAFLKNTSEDVRVYGQQHGSFPHQTTADQFFDERQFEAYRELGFQDGFAAAGDVLTLLSARCSTPAAARVAADTETLKC